MNINETVMGFDSPDLLRQFLAAPKLSICIPAYNEERNIGSLLSQIIRQDIRSAIFQELIVDVSGSTDKTKAIVSDISSRYPMVKIIDIGKRDGIYNSLLRLIDESNGDYIVRIDADVTLRDGVIERLISPLRNGSIGITGCKVLVDTGKNRFVNMVVRTEYTIHNFVSCISPKTTNIQAFKRISDTLPKGFEIEDITLQNHILSKGYKALHVNEGSISISPPDSVRALVLQRIRSIDTQRHYAQKTGLHSPTQSIRLATRAIFSAILKREVNIYPLFVFLLIESAAHVYSYTKELLFGKSEYYVWEQVSGTK